MQRISLSNKSSSYHQIFFVKINLTIALLSNIRTSKLSPNFRVSDQTTRMLSPHTRYMSPTSIFPNLIALTTFCEEHILWRFQLFSLLLLFLAANCGSAAGLKDMLWKFFIPLPINRVTMAGIGIRKQGGSFWMIFESFEANLWVTRVNFNFII